MRKLDKAIIWPAYFDVAKSRDKGRRVPKGIAVPNPKIEELQAAASRLGLKNEVVPQVSYPKMLWHKTGSLLVEKRTPKEQIIKSLARQLMKMRSEAQPQK